MALDGGMKAWREAGHPTALDLRGRRMTSHSQMTSV
jgi:hypothetical protein